MQTIAGPKLTKNGKNYLTAVNGGGLGTAAGNMSVKNNDRRHSGESLFLAICLGSLLPLLTVYNRHAVAQGAPMNPAPSARLQKITPAQKDQLFGTSQVWNQKYAARLETAPTQIRGEINATNADLAKRGKRFTVGYTSVYGANITKIGGLSPITSPNQLPRPAPPMPPQQSCLEQTAQPNSSQVDMRDYGIVTPVRDQGSGQPNCAEGFCWAFAPTAGLETAVLLANGNTPGVDQSSLALSEEQVLSCTGNFGLIANNCNGGLQMSAAAYATNHPIATSAQWPYDGAQQSNLCQKFQNQTSNYRARQWGWVCPNAPFPCFIAGNDDIKRAIVTYGSVISAINVGPEFQGYKDGYYDDNVCQGGSMVQGNCVYANNAAGVNVAGVPLTNHVIQIIGWDDQAGAWLIKNSWGNCITTPDCWGEAGFGWVAYNTINIGAWAIWIEADQYNNKACNASSGPSGNTATLEGGTITFDNAVQGKDGNEHFWVYVHSGTGTATTVATFAYTKDNQPPNSYSKGSQAKETLNVSSSITAADLIDQGGNLEIDLHGQFGGGHDNSDWQTGITLKLIFTDGTYSVVTSGPQHFHVDNSKAYAKWTGQFRLSSGATNFYGITNQQMTQF